MKNSYIIKNADPSFEAYYNAMKKRNKLLGHVEHHHFATGSNTIQRMRGRRPIARDGHTGLVVGDVFYVFGGDRHHMPFNDLYMLDLKREVVQVKSGTV
jgi:Kelch motif